MNKILPKIKKEYYLLGSRMDYFPYAGRLWFTEILILLIPFIILKTFVEIPSTAVKQYFADGLGGPRWRSYKLLLSELLNTVAVACLLGLTSVKFHNEWYMLAIPVLLDVNQKFPTDMKCTFEDDYGNTNAGLCYLGSNKFLRDQIFLVVGWMWILLIAGLINALMKLLQLLPSFRLGQLKAVAPNLDLRVARKMVKEMSYGDMLALLETAYHVGDTEAMDKVCIEAFQRVIDGWED